MIDNFDLVLYLVSAILIDFHGMVNSIFKIIIIIIMRMGWFAQSHTQFNGAILKENKNYSFNQGNKKCFCIYLQGMVLGEQYIRVTCLARLQARSGEFRIS